MPGDQEYSMWIQISQITVKPKVGITQLLTIMIENISQYATNNMNLKLT